MDGGATRATEYADQGDDQRTLMAPRPNCAVPASFTMWTDELPKAEQERRAAAAKAGNPVENYVADRRYKCKNSARCGAAFSDPQRRETHEQACVVEMARRDKLAAEDKAKWEREHPGQAYPEVGHVETVAPEVEVSSNATVTEIEAKIVAIPFPANEQYVTKDEVKDIIKGELSGFMAELKGLLGGKKTEEGDSREGSRSDLETTRQNRPEPLGEVGPGDGEIQDPPAEPEEA
jgi:hypothetical protein